MIILIQPHNEILQNQKKKTKNKTRLHVSRREQNFAQEKPHFSYLWVFQLLDENKYIRRLKKEKKKNFCWYPANDAEHHEVVHIINIGVLAPHNLISVAKREQMQDKFHIPDAMIVRICLSFILTRLNVSDC